MYQYTEAFGHYHIREILQNQKHQVRQHTNIRRKKTAKYGRLKNCAKKRRNFGEKNSTIRMTLTTIAL